MTLPWYPRDMGKYARDTKHLSLLEHGAYGQLLDYYYSTGGLPQAMLKQCSSNAHLMPDHSRIYRICNAMTKGEQDAVDAVLSFFFTLNNDGFYINEKCDQVIEEQTKKHENRVRAGSRSNARAMLEQCSTNTPQIKNKTKIDKIPLTPLPADKKKKDDLFKKNNRHKEDKERFEVRDYFTPELLAEVRAACPAWDVHVLAEKFNGWIKEPPRKPAEAFLKWAKGFTKGKAP